MPPAAVEPQSEPAATQRLETQHPPLVQLFPWQHGSPGRPQTTPSSVIASFVPPSGGAPPVPTGTSTLASMPTAPEPAPPRKRVGPPAPILPPVLAVPGTPPRPAPVEPPGPCWVPPNPDVP